MGVGWAPVVSASAGIFEWCQDANCKSGQTGCSHVNGSLIHHVMSRALSFSLSGKPRESFK